MNSRDTEIRESLNNIVDLLKQLTEEIVLLSQCFYEEEDDEDEAEEE